MNVGKERLGIALLCSVLALVASCAGTVGLLLGEGPTSGGRIGHSRIEDVVMFASMSLTLFFILLALRIGLALSCKVLPAEKLLLIRLAVISPVGLGIAMVVPGFMRFLNGGPEGLLLAGLGLLLGLGLASPLVRTRVSDLETFKDEAD